MALLFKKDLEKYKDIDEDEILNKLSAEELKQLETALEEMDPEVRARWGLEQLQSSSVGECSFEQINMLQNKRFKYLGDYHRYNRLRCHWSKARAWQ